MAAVARSARSGRASVPVVRLGSELVANVVDITGAGKEAAARMLAKHHNVAEAAIAELLGVVDESQPAPPGKKAAGGKKRRATAVASNVHFTGDPPSQPPPKKKVSKRKTAETVEPEKPAVEQQTGTKPGQTKGAGKKGAAGKRTRSTAAAEQTKSPKASRKSIIVPRNKIATEPLPASKTSKRRVAASHAKKTVAATVAAKTKKQNTTKKSPKPAAAAWQKQTAKGGTIESAQPKPSVAKAAKRKPTAAASKQPKTAKKTRHVVATPTPGRAAAAASSAQAEAEFEAQLAAVLAESQETARLERQSRRTSNGPSDEQTTLAELGNAKLLRELAFDAPGDKVAYLPTAMADTVAAPSSGRRKRTANAVTTLPSGGVDAYAGTRADEDYHDDQPIVSAMYEPGSTQHTEAIARAGSQTSPEVMKKLRAAAAAAGEVDDAARTSSASGSTAEAESPCEHNEKSPQGVGGHEDQISVLAPEGELMMSPEFQGSEDTNPPHNQPEQESTTAASTFGSGGRQSSRRARKPSKEVEKLMGMGFSRQDCEDALRKGKGDFNEAMNFLV